MLTQRCSVALVALLTSAACISQHDRNPSADIEAVRELMVELDDAAAAGDLDRFVSFLTEDFVDMPPHELPVMGRDALRTHHEPLFGAFRLRVRHEEIETHAFGDVVIQRGAGLGDIIPRAGGDTLVLNQKYLFVFRRQEDGSFKLWRAIFNDNAPLAAAR